jgi:hypothetical protein
MSNQVCKQCQTLRNNIYTPVDPDPEVVVKPVEKINSYNHDNLKRIPYQS